MKIAVAYEDGQIYQHFGHTPFFKLYEAEGRRILSSRVVAARESGHDALAGFLTENGVESLLCGNIGSGAMAALLDAGIRVYAGVVGSADGAVQALLDGFIVYNPKPGCAHEGGCGQGCCG